MDMRRCEGRKAATTMMSGKNEMNALPARAMLRSTNSVSSIRSHTFHSSVCSAQPRMTWARPRTFSNACRLVLPVLDSAMIPVLGFDRSHSPAEYADPSLASHADRYGQGLSLPGEAHRAGTRANVIEQGKPEQAGQD